MEGFDIEKIRAKVEAGPDVVLHYIPEIEAANYRDSDAECCALCKCFYFKSAIGGFWVPACGAGWNPEEVQLSAICDRYSRHPGR